MVLSGESGKLEINIIKRSNEDAQDYWDGNWLDSEIIINTTGIRMCYGASLRVEELEKFYEDLIKLSKFTSNKIIFTTLEGQLFLEFSVAVGGQVVCQGRAINQDDNSLNFHIKTDLISIDYFLTELKLSLKQYPL